ncbi:MAG: hypothetical protein QXK76_01430 [Candidatus Woesearchaeota archaeon]
MEKKNFNLTISTITFIIGAFFLLSNTKDITGAVVGISGPGGTITAITGLILIIASTAFFIFIINHGDLELERLVRETKNHEDLTVTKKIKEQEIKEKYQQEYEEYKK